MPAAASPRIFDVVVAGAGPAGLAFAAAVKQALGPGIAIALVDPRPLARDGRLRTVALAEGPRRLIDQVGAWTALTPLAQPIRRMAIYDGRARDAVRVEQLRFGGADDEPLAHMAFNDDVAAALGGAAAALGLETIVAAVTAFAPGRDAAELELADGRRLRARLVVAADGARSRLRALAEVPTVGWDTGQTGMVATIAHERDHEGLAEQHFLPGGPFAILPMRGRFSSIVWNERHADAKAIAALAPEDFLRELEYRFTLKLGALSLASRVEAIPFSFRFARRSSPSVWRWSPTPPTSSIRWRGRGSISACATSRLWPRRSSSACGSASIRATRRRLQTYQRARRFDVVSSSLGMDALNRLFANDLAPLRFARDFGLRVVDRLSPLKRLLAAEAAGDGVKAPRLLRGLAL